jgi:hypothetical protein
VKQLHPNAPLAHDFDSKSKKLIPIVYNHGNAVTNELHYGVPMILASHGYFVVSPNAIDGSSIYSQDMDGKDIWFDPSEGENMVLKNSEGKKEANPKFWDSAFKTTEKRVRSTHLLCDDISQNDFCKNTIGSDISLDLDRMISSG